MVGICSVLIFIFGCYMAARYWTHAAHGKLPGSVVMGLIGLRSLIALEFLLPTALFFSVVMAIDQFIRQRELLALFSCGIGLGRLIRAVVVLAAAVSVLVALLSLSIRPWAWHQFFLMKARAKASFDLSRMKPGVFYEIWDGKRVIFAEKISKDKKRAWNLFIKTGSDPASSVQVIYAESARQVMDESALNPVLILENGREYELSPAGASDFVLEFKLSRMVLEPRSIVLEERVKSAPTMRLLKEKTGSEALSELQWRLLMPISGILLALCAVAISLRFSSMTGRRSSALAAAIIVFALYYNLMAILKKWLAQGVIPAFPGLGIGLCMLAVLDAALFWPELSRWLAARRAKA